MNTVLNQIQNRLIWIYPLLAILIYWPTRHAGFVHDYTGWYERYQTYDWGGIPHCFGYHRLQHVMHFFHFLIYKLFDASPLPWYFIYAILFGINAYLIYWLAGLIIKYVGGLDHRIPLFASLMFLIHPYHTTAVVWKVCFHYLLATFFVLLMVGYTIQWINAPSRKKLLVILALYILSLFTQELTVAVPLISAILVIFAWCQRSPTAKRAALYIVLPQFLLLPLYFQSAPLLLLETGKSSLLSGLNIEPTKQLSAVYRYGTKHSLFTRYWSHDAKSEWNNLWDYATILIPVVFISLALLILFFIYYRKIDPLIKVAVLALLCFAAAIGPFTSTYESYILYTTNDMYGFSASGFLLIGIVTLLRWFPVRIGNVLLLLYGLLSFIFLSRTIFYWHENAHVMNSLLDDFRWYDQKHVYVLSSPDNFMGSLMMKSHEASMLDDHLLVKNGTFPACEIEDIIQFNMTKRSDGVNVIIHSQDSLSVKFNQWGTWHWRNGIGATSYSNEKFDVKLDLPYYHLKRKQTEDGTVYIYQDGDKWKEVKEWTK